jgi:hypothetical protein
MMRTIYFSVLIMLAIGLASCAERGQMPAKGFEGTITEVIQVPGIADVINAKRDSLPGADEQPSGIAALGVLSNMTLKMYVRENKVAYDVSILGGLITMRSIVDRNMRTMTMLMPNRTAMVMDLRAMDSLRGRVNDSIRNHAGIFDSLAHMMPQPTGAKQTIHGLEAEEYRATQNGMDVDLWLSSNDKIKAFEIVRDAFLGRGSEGPGGLGDIIGMMRPVAGKIPVKFETKRNGKTFAKGELTDITEEKLDDAIFEIPKDYTIVNGDSVREVYRMRAGKPGMQQAPEPSAPKRKYTAP